MFGQDEDVVGVNGVDKAGADGQADSHREMVVDLDWKRRSGRENALCCCCDGKEEQQAEGRVSIDHVPSYAARIKTT